MYSSIFEITIAWSCLSKGLNRQPFQQVGFQRQIGPLSDSLDGLAKRPYSCHCERSEPISFAVTAWNQDIAFGIINETTFLEPVAPGQASQRPVIRLFTNVSSLTMCPLFHTTFCLTKIVTQVTFFRDLQKLWDWLF